MFNDYDDYNYDYDSCESEYPCDTCPFADTCDGWEAQACSTLNEYYGITDYDPWDV